jgi:hypothetical protein
MNPVLTFDGANGMFNPYKFSEDCRLKGKPFLIRFTKRAKEELDKMQGKLTIEMQIYFSCMVQKRVLFHENYENESVAVNDKLSIALRVVQSDVCDPIYYANHHPEKAELTSDKAEKMTAKELIFDYKKEGWIGGFKIT